MKHYVLEFCKKCIQMTNHLLGMCQKCLPRNRVIIAGSRTFKNKRLLFDKCDRILKNLSDIEIVCGEAKGPDTYGKHYAKARGHKVKSFPADWAKYGRAAGPKRNLEMALYANKLIAFWDGKSRGTKDMISRAYQLGLKVRVIKYKPI